MPPGAPRDAEIKAVKLDLPQLSISTISKSSFKARFSKVEKALLDEQKAQQKAESKKALDAVTSFFSDPKNEGKNDLVLQLPISANSKAIQEVLSYLQKKDKSKTVYLFAADNGGKVVHGCHVPEVCLFRLQYTLTKLNQCSKVSCLHQSGQVKCVMLWVEKQVARARRPLGMGFTVTKSAKLSKLPQHIFPKSACRRLG